MSDPTVYTVGWIAAIPCEFDAAKAFLDEKHAAPARLSRHDNNTYALGKIGEHNVVIASLPPTLYGTTSAAAVATDMWFSFPNIRIVLMVGVAGGAPSPRHDIRLGDIVVSTPGNGKGGVFQYDFGKALQNNGFQTTGFLSPPPVLLTEAVAGLGIRGHRIEAAVEDVLNRNPRLREKYSRPDPATDKLYRSDFVHPYGKEHISCLQCCGSDPRQLVPRAPRDQNRDNTVIHYGLVGSGNSLVRDALLRDRLAEQEGILCFEMEAAGLMNHFPCLVIRGICDYSDSHKNKEWQGYATMSAAAYAKDLLLTIAPTGEAGY
ncbi:hypothetical protein ACJ41O_010108 [Fusarium nematophilum]